MNRRTWRLNLMTTQASKPRRTLSSLPFHTTMLNSETCSSHILHCQQQTASNVRRQCLRSRSARLRLRSSGWQSRSSHMTWCLTMSGVLSYSQSQIRRPRSLNRSPWAKSIVIPESDTLSDSKEDGSMRRRVWWRIELPSH